MPRIINQFVWTVVWIILCMNKTQLAILAVSTSSAWATMTYHHPIWTMIIMCRLIQYVTHTPLNSPTGFKTLTAKWLQHHM